MLLLEQPLLPAQLLEQVSKLEQPLLHMQLLELLQLEFPEQVNKLLFMLSQELLLE